MASVYRAYQSPKAYTVQKIKVIGSGIVASDESVFFGTVTNAKDLPKGMNFRKELVRRYNAHDVMLSALKLIASIEHCNSANCAGMRQAATIALREINKANPCPVCEDYACEVKSMECGT